jgi:hypothetical protein
MIKSLPCVLGVGAFKETMLKVLKNHVGANLARGGDPHALELGADRETAVQGEPDEGTHFARQE